MLYSMLCPMSRPTLGPTLCSTHGSMHDPMACPMLYHMFCPTVSATLYPTHSPKLGSTFTSASQPPRQARGRSEGWSSQVQGAHEQAQPPVPSPVPLILGIGLCVRGMGGSPYLISPWLPPTAGCQPMALEPILCVGCGLPAHPPGQRMHVVLPDPSSLHLLPAAVRTCVWLSG